MPATVRSLTYLLVLDMHFDFGQFQMSNSELVEGHTHPIYPYKYLRMVICLVGRPAFPKRSTTVANLAQICETGKDYTLTFCRERMHMC
jgi:hypothetical protein